MGRRRFTPYSSSKGYKQGTKIFGSILGAGLNIGGAIVKDVLNTPSAPKNSSSDCNIDKGSGNGCIGVVFIVIWFILSMIISATNCSFLAEIGWSVLVALVLLGLFCVNESNQKTKSLKPEPMTENLNKCDLPVITAEMTTELLNSLNDYELPDEVVNLPNDNLYWYLRGVNSIREKIQKSTKGALDAKRKRGDAMGGDARCWGMKAEHMKNLSTEERAEYRKDKIQHCVNVSAKNRRAKAMSNPKNTAFWYFITDYIKINGEPKPRTDYWTICAQELNKRGLTTSTGRPFTNGNACSTYCHLKQMFSE